MAYGNDHKNASWSLWSVDGRPKGLSGRHWNAVAFPAPFQRHSALEASQHLKLRVVRGTNSDHTISHHS
ncbi:hypothetical protein EVAR_67615_1 [Eumeta japonica]|uniref:Uncharacterized protein n=1 Tax=Eumeta variegata TaxID=151549 RepID=A0A4C2A6D5_EUMVA|nr:hypothetical protein EVAR_67615_1 [Eumeta japonica]